MKNCQLSAHQDGYRAGVSSSGARVRLSTRILLKCGMALVVLAGCQQSTPEPQAQNANSEAPQLNESSAQFDFSGMQDGEGQPSGDPHPAILSVQTASQRSIRQGAPSLGTSASPSASGQDLSVSAASGTPEWDIQQIAAILGEAKRAQRAAGGDDREVPLTDEQNRRIAALASHAIANSHDRPEKELVFNAAVHSLMDARLNLALAGDQKSLDAVYEDAATLKEKHGDSSAAATAASAVVRMARKMAEREDRQSPWVSEYVRQAKLFAANFPSEEARAIVQLTTAAEFCEQHQLILPAIECYTFIQQKFPSSPFNQRSDAALQRLNLIGKTLPLDGPTLEGETVRLETLRGRPVLLAFWSARSTAFVEDLPVIRELCERSGCHLLGINLDTNADSVRQFVTAQQMPGQHIFYNEASLQGAAQPIARQFGIHTVPSYWLIDREGKVLSTCVTRSQLQALVRKSQ